MPAARRNKTSKQSAPQLSRPKKKPGPVAAKPLNVHCNICGAWLAGDLTRHKRKHAPPAVKYRYWCSEKGCNRSNMPGNKGFPQKSNMLGHVETMHKKKKFPCPHVWICGGQITPCNEELADRSSLDRHRKSVHGLGRKYRAPPKDLLTLCTADHRHGGDHKKPKIDGEEALDEMAVVLGIAPVAGWNNAKDEQSDCGSSVWDDAEDKQPDFGLLPSTPSDASCNSCCTETMDPLITVIQRIWTQSSPVEAQVPAPYDLQQDPIYQYCLAAATQSMPAPPLPLLPQFVSEVPQTLLPGTDQVCDGYPPSQFYNDFMGVFNPYDPQSRESTMSPPALPPSEIDWARSGYFTSNGLYF